MIFFSEKSRIQNYFPIFITTMETRSYMDRDRMEIKKEIIDMGGQWDCGDFLILSSTL